MDVKEHQRNGIFAGLVAFVVVLLILFLIRYVVEDIVDSAFYTVGAVIIAGLAGLGAGMAVHDRTKPHTE